MQESSSSDQDGVLETTLTLSAELCIQLDTDAITQNHIYRSEAKKVENTVGLCKRKVLDIYMKY